MVYLDSAGIDIAKVELKSNPYSFWHEIDFEISTPHEELGDMIKIDCTGADTYFWVKLTYATNENQTAASWLRPE